MFSDASDPPKGFGDYALSPNNFVKESHIRSSANTPCFYDQTWTDAWPIESSAASLNVHGNCGTIPGGGTGTEMPRIAKARHGSGGSGIYASRNLGSGTGQSLPGLINMGFAVTAMPNR
jgi:hypothetical protein